MGEPTYLVVGLGMTLGAILGGGVGYLVWYWNVQYPASLGGKRR